jgi:hypothetical protein
MQQQQQPFRFHENSSRSTLVEFYARMLTMTIKRIENSLTLTCRSNIFNRCATDETHDRTMTIKEQDQQNARVLMFKR